MIDRLEELVALLRRNGVRVSVGEAIDAARALETVGLGSPATVRAALEATLVKRRGDAAVFGELFGLFFYHRADLAAARSDVPLAAALAARGLSEDEIERLLAELATAASRLHPGVRMALGLRRPDLELLLRLAGVRRDLIGLAGPMQVGFVSQRLLSELGVIDAEREVRALVAECTRRLQANLGEARASALREAVDEALRSLRAAVRGMVESEIESRHARFEQDARSGSLLDKPIARMSEEELVALRAEVDRLARKLRAAHAARRRPRRRGRLDPRRTFRASLATGGVPAVLRWRRRRPDRPELVLLVDISDSMRDVARFMLELVFTVQERFARVRSFVFVSDVGEVTGLFRQYEIGEAIARAYAGEVINVHANTNVGHALARFRERHADAVTSRTTLLVISDGRNNYHVANAGSLAALRARARRVLWLNPEQPAAWSFGDSAMRDYAPHCDRVEVVYNVAGLRRVVDSLGLAG